MCGGDCTKNNAHHAWRPRKQTKTATEVYRHAYRIDVPLLGLSIYGSSGSTIHGIVFQQRIKALAILRDLPNHGRLGVSLGGSPHRPLRETYCRTTRAQRVLVCFFCVHPRCGNAGCEGGGPRMRVNCFETLAILSRVSFKQHRVMIYGRKESSWKLVPKYALMSARGKRDSGAAEEEAVRMHGRQLNRLHLTQKSVDLAVTATKWKSTPVWRRRLPCLASLDGWGRCQQGDSLAYFNF